jgi:hypothetical protein
MFGGRQRAAIVAGMPWADIYYRDTEQSLTIDS